MSATGKRGPVAVLGGAGAMGRAVVYDLAHSGVAVRLLDSDPAAAARIARRYGAGRARAEMADAADPASLRRGLAGARVVVICAPYRLNLAVMEAALETRCHYLDLGGLFHTTRRQLRLHLAFRRRRLLAVLGMGSAPGITNVLAGAAAARLRRVESLHVYNGGADFTRYRAPVAFTFSPATVLDELTQPAMVFAGGRFRTAPARSGAEEFPFEAGVQKVQLSLHSEVATLPLSLRAKGLRECSFKIAYDPELVQRLKLLIDLGLTDPHPGPRGVSPRDVLLDCFRRLPRPPELIDDRDFLVVVARGRDRRGPLTVRYDLTAHPQRRPSLSAVACDTGFAPAIVARMILEGRIGRRGVFPPERCVPVRPFLAELARRGLGARLTLTRPDLG